MLEAQVIQEGEVIFTVKNLKVARSVALLQAWTEFYSKAISEAELTEAADFTFSYTEQGAVVEVELPEYQDVFELRVYLEA